MKKIILIIIAYSLQLTAQSGWWWKYSDAVSYEAETLAYQARVEADGGVVINIDDVNTFYKNAKANNYLDSLHYCLLYTGGIKDKGGNIDSVWKWYDLTSNEKDFSAISIGTYVPLFSMVDGVGDNTTPSMNSVSVTYNQPAAYYAIIKRLNPGGNGYFWGSSSDHAFLQNPDRTYYLYAGADLVLVTTYPNNTFFATRIIYNGANTSAQINNGAISTGNAGSNNVNGIFGLFKEITDTFFKCFVSSKQLSSTKDAALKNILNTIYPTY